MSKGVTVAHAVRGCRGVNALAKEGEQLAEQLEQANASRDYWMKAAQKTDETCGKLAEQAKSLSESRARMAARVVELSHLVARASLDGEQVRKQLARTEHSRRRAHARIQWQRQSIAKLLDSYHGAQGEANKRRGGMLESVREDFGRPGIAGLLHALRTALAVRGLIKAGVV